MTSLSADEQHYLRQAFDASPEAWFRPTDVASQQFSGRRVDEIVAALVGAGMMDGQPNCHARLTSQGRKHAAQLGRPPRNEWRRARTKHKLVVAASSAFGVVVVALLLLLWSGIL